MSYPPDPVPIVVPDVAGVIVGWRSWVAERAPDGSVRLRSVIRRRYTWPHRQECEAACPYAPEHKHHSEEEYAPSEGCSCGIHAALAPKQVKPYLIGYWNDSIAPTDIWRIFGKVSLWGRVIEGDKGWRAQYAYPHSLVLPAEAIDCEPLSVMERDDLARELREAYGVPVFVEIRRPLVRRLLRR